jgi:hypothetical protein
MASQSPGNLLMQGGALTGDANKVTFCQAFEAAVNDFCSHAPRARGDFNDYFFDHLNNRASAPGGSALAANMNREMGALFRFRTFVGFVIDLALGGGGGAGLAGSIANQMMRAAPLIGVMASTRVAPGDMHQAQFDGRNTAYTAQGVNPPTPADIAAGNYPNTTFRPTSVDATYRPGGTGGDRAFEIKGPGDNFDRNPGQARDIQAMDSQHQPYVVSCEACGLRCRRGCPAKGPVKHDKNYYGQPTLL